MINNKKCFSKKLAIGYKLRRVLFFSFLSLFLKLNSVDMYICTCGDTQFYPQLLNFIGSLHKVNFNEIKEIAVFNLGFTKDQINNLKRIEKVSVYDIEMTHPDLLKFFPVRPRGRKMRRGYYAWKAVAIKQALDMFPYILYVDAGTIILESLDNVFKHILQNEHLIISADKPKYTIRTISTRFVIDNLDLESDDKKHILDKIGIASGFMGITKRLYGSFVLPVYNLTYDLRYFANDGTAPLGFNCCVQTLYGIYARLLDLEVKDWNGSYLSVDGKKINFLLHEGTFRFWGKVNEWKKMREYIMYKKD